MKEIDEEFNLLQLYIYDCINRMCLNAYIDKTKCSHHPLYTFEEYKTAIWDPWTGETVASRTRWALNIKPLF
jgi:hypothetical protein